MNEKRFIDNGDGTVTDKKTGLMWQQSTTGPMTWDAAINYCMSLSLGGHGDWRLPDIHELQYLVDYARHDPAINTDVFADMPEAVPYWSSTIDAYCPDRAWFVYFGNGEVFERDKSLDYYVRAVRGGQWGPGNTDKN